VLAYSGGLPCLQIAVAALLGKLSLATERYLAGLVWLWKGLGKGMATASRSTQSLGSAWKAAACSGGMATGSQA